MCASLGGRITLRDVWTKMRFLDLFSRSALVANGTIFFFFVPSDMLIALTTQCTWQFVGGLRLRHMCFVSSAHVAARCASTRCELRFCFFLVCPGFGIVLLDLPPRICCVSGYLALFSPGCKWLGAVAVVSRLVVKRFPFVPSWLNVCVEPDMLMPAEGRHMLRMRSR